MTRRFFEPSVTEGLCNAHLRCHACDVGYITTAYLFCVDSLFLLPVRWIVIMKLILLALLLIFIEHMVYLLPRQGISSRLAKYSSTACLPCHSRNTSLLPRCHADWPVGLRYAYWAMMRLSLYLISARNRLSAARRIFQFLELLTLFSAVKINAAYSCHAANIIILRTITARLHLSI